jgi:putative Holliday junction resolvase
MLPPQPPSARHGRIIRARRRAEKRGGSYTPLPILSNLEAFARLTRSGTDRKSDQRCGLLALDVSRRSIGIAGADPDWRLATPLVTVRRRRWAQDMTALSPIMRERQVGALVIGWPLNMDGSEGPRCQAIRAFAERLERELGLPMLLWDERLTTFAAEAAADRVGLRGKKRAAMLDALAAAAILQDALNRLTRSVDEAAGQRRPALSRPES